MTMETNAVIEIQGDVIVGGTTYGVRDYLHSCGGKYDGDTKTWSLTAAQRTNFADIMARVANPTGNKKARDYAKAMQGLIFTPAVK